MAKKFTDRMGKIEEKGVGESIIEMENLHDDFVKSINELFDELNKNLTKQKKHQIKFDLEKLFVEQIIQINNSGSEEDKIAKFGELVGGFTENIKIEKFEDLAKG